MNKEEREEIVKRLLKSKQVPVGFHENPKAPDFSNALLVKRVNNSVDKLSALGFTGFSEIRDALKGIWFVRNIGATPAFHSQMPGVLAFKSGQMTYLDSYLVDDKQNRIDDGNKNLNTIPMAAVAVACRKGCENLPPNKKILTLDDLKKIGVTMVKYKGEWHLKGKNKGPWDTHSAQRWQTAAVNRLLRHFFQDVFFSIGEIMDESDLEGLPMPENDKSRAENWAERNAEGLTDPPQEESGIELEQEPSFEVEQPPVEDPPPPPQQEEKKEDSFDKWSF